MSTRRSISTPERLYAELRHQCERDGFTVSAVVQGLIEQYLARRDPSTREMAQIRDGILDVLVDGGHAARPCGVTLIVQAMPGRTATHDVEMAASLAARPTLAAAEFQRAATPLGITHRDEGP